MKIAIGFLIYAFVYVVMTLFWKTTTRGAKLAFLVTWLVVGSLVDTIYLAVLDS